MSVTGLAVTAFVAISLNGLFLALAIAYRQNVKKLRNRVERLTGELNASRAWNGELATAASDTEQLLASDPMHRERLTAQLPRRDDPLEQLYAAPAFVPAHERRHQDGAGE